jgi:hypothetical protein
MLHCTALIDQYTGSATAVSMTSLANTATCMHSTSFSCAMKASTASAQVLWIFMLLSRFLQYIGCMFAATHVSGSGLSLLCM